MICWNDNIIPSANGKIKEIRRFLKKYKLDVKTARKNKKRILIDIKQILITKKEIPKDILSHLFTFLYLDNRCLLSVICKRIQECVFSTNQNDNNIEVLAGFKNNGNFKYLTHIFRYYRQICMGYYLWYCLHSFIPANYLETHIQTVAHTYYT